MTKAKRDHFFLVMVQSFLAVPASLAVLLSLPAWPTAIDAHREVSRETAAAWRSMKEKTWVSERARRAA